MNWYGIHEPYCCPSDNYEACSFPDPYNFSVYMKSSVKKDKGFFSGIRFQIPEEYTRDRLFKETISFEVEPGKCVKPYFYFTEVTMDVTGECCGWFSFIPCSKRRSVFRYTSSIGEIVLFESSISDMYQNNRDEISRTPVIAEEIDSYSRSKILGREKSRFFVQKDRSYNPEYFVSMYH
ncbi:hypothetical protein AYI70_g4534 [Smittium culicis]|uniref:Uncharacterized protein n=1 Tax=Smittium culicis TaxID=133412 RepID=A0A1R1XZ09_9FUNG|nr:hypothetical protein AYI70_g4534 [Smittium culicis]